MGDDNGNGEEVLPENMKDEKYKEKEEINKEPGEENMKEAFGQRKRKENQDKKWRSHQEKKGEKERGREKGGNSLLEDYQKEIKIKEIKLNRNVWERK